MLIKPIQEDIISKMPVLTVNIQIMELHFIKTNLFSLQPEILVTLIRENTNGQASILQIYINPISMKILILTLQKSLNQK